MKTTDCTAKTEKLYRLAQLTPTENDKEYLERELNIIITASQKLTSADFSCVGSDFAGHTCPLRDDLPDENAESPILQDGVFAVKRIIS